jgi:hypothetical protein
LEKEPDIRYFATTIVFLCGACIGCQSHRANPKWVADLNRTDKIVVRADEATMTITDPEAIDRFATIYTSAKWKPYWHTLPGNLGDRSFDMYADSNKLRHFSYTGVLWENERYDSNRTAVLSDEDQEWIESLFDDVASSASDAK